MPILQWECAGVSRRGLQSWFVACSYPESGEIPSPLYTGGKQRMSSIDQLAAAQGGNVEIVAISHLLGLLRTMPLVLFNPPVVP